MLRPTRIALGALVVALMTAMLHLAPARAQIAPEPDANGDGRVNSTDLLVVVKGLDGADVNHDGRADSLDYDIVVRAIEDAMGLPPASATPAPAQASSGWRGEYYNNTTLSGGVAATRQDGPVLAFAWPSAPAAGVNADYFSVRWTMTLESAGGAYQFNTRHDDGARLYIDGALVLDTWWDQMPASYSVSRTLSAGAHQLEYDYYHTYAGAVAQLEIVAAGAATATSTPAPAATNTPTPTAAAATPTATSVAPTPTAAAATSTPAPASTSTPTPTAAAATNTPAPAATSTPTATRTATPVPATSTPTAVAGGRNKLLQPFASDSPWNMPLGTSLSLVAANLPKTFMSVDEEPIILAPGAPLRSGYENGDWPASCRTSGATPLGQFPVPDGYVIPEPSGGFLPNYSGGVLLGDGRTIVEMQYGTRCASTGPLTMGIQRDRHDIYGSGLGYGIGGHGGSGLSGVAGSLRVWEVNGDAPIRHALKLNISAKFLSKSNGGYRWPAVVADTGYNQPGNFMEYVGTNPALRMGSLLVLPATVDINTLGLQTAMGRRLAWTLQNYGAYIVDSGPQTWTPHNWVIEYGVQQAMETRWGYGVDGGPMNSDSLILMSLLQVVDNNGPTSVGGGGARVQPLLPAISN